MGRWISGWFWGVARWCLFRMNAERAHRLTIASLACAPRLARKGLRVLLGPTTVQRPTRLGPLCLRGPIGLAAGLDKDGEAVEVWPALGFGFIEVGSVTFHPQSGNPQPRLFRLPNEGALINRMGFNNEGAVAMATRLRALKDRGRWPHIPVGVNIGKSKITPISEAVEDYVASAEVLKDVADYLVINVSSPNTPGLRGLQDSETLNAIIRGVQAAAKGVPLLVKLSPDLDDAGLDAAVNTAIDCGCTGIIATNTTLQRPGKTDELDQTGGLSGAPLWPIAQARITRVLASANGRIPVIGSGGVCSAPQARTLLDAGCVAVQLYSGLIFHGPGLVHQINDALVERSQ